jgi:hypothetical protein
MQDLLVSGEDQGPRHGRKRVWIIAGVIAVTVVASVVGTVHASLRSSRPNPNDAVVTVQFAGVGGPAPGPANWLAEHIDFVSSHRTITVRVKGGEFVVHLPAGHYA